MRLLKASLLAAAMVFTFPVSAQPELAPLSLLEFGQYQKVEQRTIYGDINQDIVALAKHNTSASEADLFVIDDINEDINLNMLIVSVSLYKNLNDGLVSR
ncbi:hypothetical protein [Enterovibrio nigricans]|uniref:Uncharacterized protein n=1 Tax=Enterovibrio nigricans DSM 22720 TaxID=1121868 RepID=A0A1T4UHU0_9GAMM|nr:hypothetical protein [Enterovibrio nigricans]PKF50425.1 hypothetical protein AT251_11660 [Enterovibrio nigricans]SKA52362.1 hypothetical protein SAMN02745132_01801 [Enterovibrio nigricans DSM 22720]